MYKVSAKKSVEESCLMIPKGHSVHPPRPTFCGGVEPPTKFSKRGGGLTGRQLLEGDAGKEDDDFFQGRWGVAIFT